MAVKNGITLDEWIKAEEEFRQTKLGPQPENTITSRQYAEMTKRPYSTVRHTLNDMAMSGALKREKWNGQWVYYLPKK